MEQNIVQGEIPDTIGQLEFLWYFVLRDVPVVGAIPLSMSNLTSLLTLEIVNTKLTGHIPPQIGLLPNLYWLSLEENLFTGVIPSSLGNCSTLSVLELGFNALMDPEPIPPWIESLTNLTVLELAGKNHEGELPKSSIGRLSNLRYFDVSVNNLTGKIPTSFQNCTYLTTLGVGSNHFSGDIPPELGALRYMATFSAYFNALTDSFPGFIANWTHLLYFDVYGNYLSGLLDGGGQIGHLQELTRFVVTLNDFEGPIPETIGNCTSIYYLAMDGNRLSGTIPASLGNLTNLQELYLGTNDFQGHFPVNLAKYGLQLTVLTLDENKLEGIIPWEIGQLVQLSKLYLFNNKFTGIIPSSLGNCSKIAVLDLRGNQLDGNVPGIAISKMSASLINLDLSSNRFSGSWPNEFNELTEVQVINVSSNDISGSIPLGLGKCINLNSLDISMNNLTGEIPEDLGSLAYLEFFNASFNNFIGSIPQSGIFNGNRINESSFLENPGLCGSIALHHQECTVIPQKVSTDHEDCKGFSCKQVWIPIAVVSSLILVGAMWITLWFRTGWVTSRQGRDAGFKMGVLLKFDVHMRLTERDVLQTIDDPRGDNVIGQGARSIVYKGVLPGGQMFALKKLLPYNAFRGQDDDSSSHDALHSELVKEGTILAKLRHKNILKCLGFYSDLKCKALIVEYMGEGSLHKHLHELEPCSLTWQTRLKVVVGVAQAMKYLHHDFPEPLIHRDLKPSNIFLDADFEPKVGDFGIFKFVGAQRDGEATASRLSGTIGYMPPEYASQAVASTKGDVYSYGIVVLELLTRRRPCSKNALDDALDDQVIELRNAVAYHFLERPLELLDPSLVKECSLDTFAKEQMMLLLRVSLFCTKSQTPNPPLYD